MEGPFNGRRVVGGHSVQIGQLVFRLSRRTVIAYCAPSQLLSVDQSIP
jgi:hypothetical protein